MKSTFLVRTAVPSNGKTTLSLADVNSGEGLNDFRSGSRDGLTAVDVYGDCPFATGDTIVLELRKLDETADTAAPAGEAATEATVLPFTLPVEIPVTIAIDETGAVTIKQPSAETGTPAAENNEQVEQTNTETPQPEAGAAAGQEQLN